MKTLLTTLFLAALFCGGVTAQDDEDRRLKTYEEIKRAFSTKTRGSGGAETETRKTTKRTTRGIEIVAVEVVTESQQKFEGIYFKLDSTEELADEPSKQQLEIIAKAIKDIPGEQSYLIEGHTCDLGSTSHNKHLSEDRADAVRSLLIRQGVPSGNLETLGFGESDPDVPNTSDENRRKNRRVVIFVTAR